MKKEYAIGDKTWIYVGNHKGELTEGTVVHKFHLDGWAIDFHYIVEVPTPIDPLLKVRECFTMSDNPKGPIGLWSNL